MVNFLRKIKEKIPNQLRYTDYPRAKHRAAKGLVAQRFGVEPRWKSLMKF
jgi:hypothetical protein